MTDAYRDDLAFIHDAGYGHFARAAGPVLLAELRRAGLDRGRVVDLGCGSGILSETAAAAGYDVLGIDISPSMIALAKKRVPGGEFRVGPLLAAELPPCAAVAAVGEVVNFLFDTANTDRRLWGLFRRVFAALCPGGVFLFDAAGPGRVPGRGPRRQHAEGDGWAVQVVATEDRPRRRLERRITSFRRVGELYRRDHEVHRLRLLVPSEIAERLRAAGFRVRRPAGYGAERFGPGHAGFLARKPVL
ncbi:MAG TPA: methyltransferase domain-containing protein [Gemmataceae bacterium]|jgi:SAM-dependent methyltransferase